MTRLFKSPPKPAPPKSDKDPDDRQLDFSVVPAEAQDFGSDGQPRPKLSWLLAALDKVIGARGAYWNVTYSKEEVIDAGGGEKLCSVKAVIAKVIADTRNSYVGIGYGCAMLVERISAQQYKKHMDAWDVAQEKALAAAARFFGIGLVMDPLPENKGPRAMSNPEPVPDAGTAPDLKSNDKEKALEELRAAVKTHGMGSVILKIVQYKYGTEKVESLPPALLRDLKVNMIIYRQEWQDAVKKEAAAHNGSD